MLYDILDKVLTPQILVMVLAGISGFAAVMTLAMPALARDRISGRMKLMATERDKMRANRIGELNKDKQNKLRTAPKGFMQQLVDQLNLRKAFDTDEVRDKLRMAGFRGESPRYAFVFFRFLLPILLFFGALIYFFVMRSHELPPIARLGISMGIGYIGFYLPTMFLTNLIQRRQESIKNAFPDALDLLLICVQSGMSVEAAFSKVAKEVGSASLELAEELSLTTAELSYLQDRRMAYENLGTRTGLAGVKAVATALIQAERYGTPLGQALRVMAKENRDQRMSDAEKKAAALPPKLTVPMIVFFLPVLFVVIIGPAVIQVQKLRNGS
jgi:tight adherence protein C